MLKITVHDPRGGVPIRDSVLAWVRQCDPEPTEEETQNNECTLHARMGYPIHVIVAKKGLKLRPHDEDEAERIGFDGEYGHYDTIDNAVDSIYEALSHWAGYSVTR